MLLDFYDKINSSRAFSVQKSVLCVKEGLPVVLVAVVLHFLDSRRKSTKEAIGKA